MQMSGATLKSYDTRASLAEALAVEVAACLQHALHDKGTALLVVSGGSTPVPFFQALSMAVLPWQNIRILLADERWVAADHADSNEKLVRAHLLQNAAASARFLSLAPNGAETLREGVQRIEAELKACVDAPDVTILGMGEDGHTASLFPDHPSLTEGMTSDALAIAVTDAPKPPAERLSLSAPMLAKSKQLFVHITGHGKLEVMKEHNPAHPITQMLAACANQPTIFWAE